MSKRQPTVSIRVSVKARKALRLRAAQKDATIVEVVDALLQNNR